MKLMALGLVLALSRLFLEQPRVDGLAVLAVILGIAGAYQELTKEK